MGYSSFMRGDLVIVRAFGSRPLARRLWGVQGGGAYVCGEDQFNLLAAGREAPPPIGFPREDVFEYEPQALLNLERAFTTGNNKTLKKAWSRVKRHTLATN